MTRRPILLETGSRFLERIRALYLVHIAVNQLHTTAQVFCALQCRLCAPFLRRELLALGRKSLEAAGETCDGYNQATFSRSIRN